MYIVHLDAEPSKSVSIAVLVSHSLLSVSFTCDNDLTCSTGSFLLNHLCTSFQAARDSVVGN